MPETSELMHQVSGEVLQRMDALTNLVWLAGQMQDVRDLKIIHGLIQRESAGLKADQQRFSQLMEQFRKEKLEAAQAEKEKHEMVQVRNNVTAIVIVLLMIFLMVGLVGAQDTPLATNTPAEAAVQPVATVAEATLDATAITPAPSGDVVVNVQEPTNQNSIYVVGFLAILIFTGLTQYFSNRQIGTLVETVNKALTNKMVIDEAHRLYLESSLSVQNMITLIGGVAGFIGSTIPGDDLAEQLKQFLDQAKDGPKSGGLSAGADNLRSYFPPDDLPGQNG